MFLIPHVHVGLLSSSLALILTACYRDDHVVNFCEVSSFISWFWLRYEIVKPGPHWCRKFWATMLFNKLMFSTCGRVSHVRKLLSNVFFLWRWKKCKSSRNICQPVETILGNIWAMKQNSIELKLELLLEEFFLLKQRNMRSAYTQEVVMKQRMRVCWSTFIEEHCCPTFLRSVWTGLKCDWMYLASFCIKTRNERCFDLNYSVEVFAFIVYV